MDQKELGIFLHRHGVYDAHQFIMSARESIITACYCKDLINNISSEIEKEHDEWRNAWEWEPVAGNGKMFRMNIRGDSFPAQTIDIAGVEISKFFLRDMLIRDFFQYSRNAFDAMAQAANAACLASQAMKIEDVDFGHMMRFFQKESNAQKYPDISSWFSTVVSSEGYNYIDMYCNRTKHTCGIHNKTSLPMLGTDSEASIKPFFRFNKKKELIQNETKDVVNTTSDLYSFVSHAYQIFMISFKAEVAKNTNAENRYYSLSVFQRKLKGNEDSSFSLAFIEENGCIETMPERIQVLLVSELKDESGTGEIISRNCPFDTIYIKDPSVDNHYIGKYIAEEKTGEDELLRFRNYKKYIPKQGELPLEFQAMCDEKQKGKFYHSNPFFNITTVSDDEQFLSLVNLPL